MKEQQQAYWPTSAWKTTNPYSVGMRSEDFQLLQQYAQKEALFLLRARTEE